MGKPPAAQPAPAPRSWGPNRGEWGEADDGLSRAVESTLAWGFRVGAALLAVGLALAAWRREPLGVEVDPFAAVIPAVLAGEAAAIVELAVLWLMATPVLAVVVILVGFLRRRDWRYALISLAVLLVLGVSIGLALGR